MSRLIGTDTLREVWVSISRNPARSILTAFGVFWGMFMFVVMLSVGTGLTNSIRNQFGFIPPHLVIGYSSNTSIPWEGFRKGRWWNLKCSDMAQVERDVPDMTMVFPQVDPWWAPNVTITSGKKSRTYQMKGTDPNFARVAPIALSDGRYINDLDVKDCRKVCVLGEKIVNELFDGISPVGRYVKVGGISYLCIGVVTRFSNSFNIGALDDEAVTLPYTLVQRIYNIGDQISNIIMQTGPDVPFENIEMQVRQVICSRNHVCPDDRKALQFINVDHTLKLFDSLCTGISVLLWLVGLGTLLSGAIGVSNIVMITVRERTREIGVKRALGARPGSIVAQIMSESLCLTAASGLLGFMSGILLISSLHLDGMRLGQSGMTLVNPTIDFWTGVISLGVIVLVGLAAGLLPTARAMKIKAIDAIREE